MATRYYTIIDINFDRDDLTIERVRRVGNDWVSAPPNGDGYCFDLKDRTGFFLNNTGDEITIDSAQVEFIVQSNGSRRNPYHKGSDTNVFQWRLQPSQDSSFRDSNATQAWFLPGQYVDGGDVTNLPTLTQKGTYSKTIQIVAAKTSDPDNPKSFQHDPTWIVGDGVPLQPPR